MDNQIELEILRGSFMEHFNSARTLAMTLPISHPRRKLIENEANKLQEQINKLEHERKNMS